MKMPFDMTPNSGGGGGWGGNDPVGQALITLISTLYLSGLRPKNFGPGHLETINIDIQIRVSPDGKGFNLENATANRWEQIEIDDDPDDIVGG